MFIFTTASKTLLKDYSVKKIEDQYIIYLFLLFGGFP